VNIVWVSLYTPVGVESYMDFSERLVNAIGDGEQSFKTLQEIAASTFSVCISPQENDPEDANYGLVVFETGFDTESYLIPEKPWDQMWARYSILSVTDETTTETELSQEAMINHIKTLLDDGHVVGIIPVDTMPKFGDDSFNRDSLFIHQ